MTNYDKWLMDKQKELDEMTPLLAAVEISDSSNLCLMGILYNTPYVNCTDVDVNDKSVGCVGCVKQWLLQEVSK